MGKLPMTVKEVVLGSIAQEVGIEAQDTIISINSQEVNDIFDYRYLAAAEELVIEIQKIDGEVWEIEIEKDEYEDIGIEFEDLMVNDAKSCKNRCIFCFIDQLPQNMRDTLYFKDDDSRLSFFMGNYVTLTNVDDADIDRIIKYKMSPINVSVHVTDPERRCYMLNNKYAGDIMEKITKLISGGITVNCQIVLVRGVNDGELLKKTINDLACLYPKLCSISVVPVGITKHREGLMHLESFDRCASDEIITIVSKLQNKFLAQYGSRVVYLADEFYIMANQNMPKAMEYEDFPQIENGVGLIAYFCEEFHDYLEELTYEGKDTRNISIATGVSAYKYIDKMSKTLETRYNNIKINVYAVKNNSFGEKVTVTGLLTGQDLIENLKGLDLGDELLLCRSMFKSGEEILLDDITVNELEKELEIKVKIVENNGMDFIRKILNK